VGLHAHTTDEALAVEDDPIEITLSGLPHDREPYSASFCVPQSYPFLYDEAFAARSAIRATKREGLRSRTCVDSTHWFPS